MKRRRTLIVSLLLVTALCLGIGYASVDGTVRVDGTAKLHAQTVNLTFTKYVQTSATDGVTGVVTEDLVNTPSATATYTVNNLSKANDNVVGTFTIKNNNEYNVALASVACTETAGGGYLTITCVEADGTEIDGTTVLAPGATQDVKVTVTLKNHYTGEDANVAFTVTVTGTATTAAANVNP